MKTQATCRPRIIHLSDLPSLDEFIDALKDQGRQVTVRCCWGDDANRCIGNATLRVLGVDRQEPIDGCERAAVTFQNYNGGTKLWDTGPEVFGRFTAQCNFGTNTARAGL
ncbi:MAG: hypothetical protein COT81_05480 [Candidatus Buchananbacteria bacterium CG10_big_fil_rev_8_21_14_0_10_42_9]|uniref:Uncharacterized protein n=1 Tax=Candidatus Buchananbacteria bacterium CG10_big_fil_rev_8_21_14_0_10_42_9 TaxID=1974526 RepID=A0A2H0VZU5_9BACT|nr:MAG: hypothetical protein COT81_05480 [Candidatus Buchananbacteria bacterium CG10_big_fil_rev_8_21_14_0_10_42_9]